MKIKTYFFIFLSIALVGNGLFGMNKKNQPEVFFPNEIVIEIFSFLDFQDLVKNKRWVCKRFFEIVHSSIFKGNCFKITVPLDINSECRVKKINKLFGKNTPLVVSLGGGFGMREFTFFRDNFSGKKLVGIIFEGRSSCSVKNFFNKFKKIQEISFNEFGQTFQNIGAAFKKSELIGFLAGNKQFEKLKKLEFANDNQHLNDELVEKLVKSKHLTNLEVFSLINCSHVTILSIRLIANSENFKNLKVFNCDLNNEKIGAIASSGGLKKVRYKELHFMGDTEDGRAEIEDDGLKWIGESIKFNKLREISIRRCPITSRGIGDLIGTSCFRNLQTVILQSCSSLDDKAILWIVMSPNAEKIKNLFLADIKTITDRSLDFIAHSDSHLKGLEKLHICRIPITDRGIKFLCKSTGLKKLKELIVLNCYTTNKSVKDISRSDLKLERLECSNFPNITIEVLEYIFTSKNLRGLKIIRFTALNCENVQWLNKYNRNNYPLKDTRFKVSMSVVAPGRSKLKSVNFMSRFSKEPFFDRLMYNLYNMLETTKNAVWFMFLSKSSPFKNVEKLKIGLDVWVHNNGDVDSDHKKA